MAEITNCAARTEAVLELNDEELDQLLSFAREAGVEIIRQPRTGLLMQTVKDAFDAPFHLGEVLVAEAEVALEGGKGYGMVIGDSLRHALGRACAEVLLDQADQLMVARVQRLLTQATDRRQSVQQREAELIARTRVRFDLMAGS